MSKIALICISLIFLGITWIIYKRNIELFLCLLIAVYSNLFYLTPKLFGPDDYKLLLLPIIIILLAVNIFTGKFELGRYGWWVIAFLGISTFGVVVAWLAGQSFALGIKAAKFIPLVLVYFLLAGRKTDGDRFANYFIVMAIAVAFIASLQYLAHNRINFFHGLPPKSIFSETSKYYRVTIGQYVISAATVVAFARYQQTSRIMFLFATMVLFGEVIIVEQIRGFIVAIFLSMVVVYILSHKLTALRISAYMIVTGICLCSWMFISGVDFSNLSLVQRTKADFSKHEGSFGGSYQARLNAYDYYFKQVQEQPFTGRGLWNYNWEGDNEKYLEHYRYIHLSDIGITHFIVQAGLIGAAWLMWGLLRLWKDIFRFRKQLAVASYFIIATFTMPTLDMLLRSDSMFIFIVFLGMSSSMINVVKNAPAMQVSDPWMYPSS